MHCTLMFLQNDVDIQVQMFTKHKAVWTTLLLQGKLNFIFNMNSIFMDNEYLHLYKKH